MTSPTVKVVHPRKLHAMLMACPTSQSRVTAALEFVCACTVAPAGFLFLSRNDQLELVATHKEGQPSPGLIEEVQRVWRQKKRTPGTDQTTVGISGSMHRLRGAEEKSEWVSPAGERFEHRLLSVDRDGRWC